MARPTPPQPVVSAIIASATEAAREPSPDYSARLVEDAMSLQLAIFQVIRALDDGALDPKRATLKLYALQIAASNLKRLNEEAREVAHNADQEKEASLCRLFVDLLQIPETEVERIVNEEAEERERRPSQLEY